MSQVTMTPELLYQIVASNPNLKNLVDRTVQVMQTQQQIVPQVQQMVQNPLGALNNYVSWQHENAASSAMQQPQQPIQNQGGNQQMGMYEQAMGIVEEFRKCFNTMNDNFIILNNNLKEIHSEIDELKKNIPKEEKTDTKSKAKE